MQPTQRDPAPGACVCALNPSSPPGQHTLESEYGRAVVVRALLTADQGHPQALRTADTCCLSALVNGWGKCTVRMCAPLTLAWAASPSQSLSTAPRRPWRNGRPVGASGAAGSRGAGGR